MEVLAFLGTVLAGFFGAAFGDSLFNWPDAGVVFAIATMGTFILRAIRNSREK